VKLTRSRSAEAGHAAQDDGAAISARCSSEQPADSASLHPSRERLGRCCFHLDRTAQLALALAWKGRPRTGLRDECFATEGTVGLPESARLLGDIAVVPIGIDPRRSARSLSPNLERQEAALWHDCFRPPAASRRAIALATLRSPGSGPTGRDAEDRVRPRRRIRHRSPVRSLVGVRESDDRSDVQPCDNEEQASGRRRADRGKEKPQRERLGHQRRLRGLSAPICTPRANAARRGSECASTSGTYAIRSPRRTSLVSARRR
jgi:hypothetical protein